MGKPASDGVRGGHELETIVRARRGAGGEDDKALEFGDGYLGLLTGKRIWFRIVDTGSIKIRIREQDLAIEGEASLLETAQRFGPPVSQDVKSLNLRAHGIAENVSIVCGIWSRETLSELPDIEKWSHEPCRGLEEEFNQKIMRNLHDMRQD